MISLGSHAHGQRKRRGIPILGQTFFKAEWMESGEDPVLSPTVSLIEQPANTTLAAHFHRQNQFQLFVDGGASLGPTSLAPVTVHYAGAYTAYGPLVAGAEGIKYFTMRPVCESGLLTVADSRDQMLRGPKRHAHTASIEVAAIKDLQNLSAPQTDTAMPFADDGLGVSLTRLPRNTPLSAVTVPNSQGQFIVVLAGTLGFCGAELGQWESLFISADEEFPILIAGAAGVQIISMHVPLKAAAYL